MLFMRMEYKFGKKYYKLLKKMGVRINTISKHKNTHNSFYPQWEKEEQLKEEAPHFKQYAMSYEKWEAMCTVSTIKE